MRNHIIIACLLGILLIISGFTYIKVLAAPIDPTKYPDLSVTAQWNDTLIAFHGSTTLPVNIPGTFGWRITYNPSAPGMNATLAVFSNAVYTVSLFKGTVGNSRLIYQATTSPLIATSTGSFTTPIPGTGDYFLTYTATYPEDVYPNDWTGCHGDFCIVPQYSLNDFTEFVTQGQYGNDSDYGHPVPALLGIMYFSVIEPLGPHSSNVLFLPGLMGSRLYTTDSQGKEKLLWEPIKNADISRLALDEFGNSKNKIYTRDIVDYLYSQFPTLNALVTHITKDQTTLYGPFKDFMNLLVSMGVIKEWAAFPYDWRYSADDIVKDGVLIGQSDGSTHRVYLQDAVAALASTSPTGKVTIIAHSYGGLIAKALAINLENSGKSNLLDKVILVGTPQTGTPVAIGSLLHADNQTRMLGLVTVGSTIRTLTRLMPGIYGLIPSSLYFDLIYSPVATFATDTLVNAYAQAYGTAIHSYEGMLSFLADAIGIRASVADTDLRTPISLLSSLLQKADDLHSLIDTWVPTSPTSLISITEIGQLTVSGYAYSTVQESSKCNLIDKILTHCVAVPTIRHEPLVTTEGDDTVVFISGSVNPGKQLFFDADAYRIASGTDIRHQSLLSAGPIQRQLFDLLTGSSAVESYISTTTPPVNTVDGTVISAHSPMNLIVTDSIGHESGVVEVTGIDFPLIKEEIPGSSVQVIDDEQYIYIPSGVSYSVSLHGTGSGATTLQIGTSHGNGSISQLHTFTNIPTTANTTGTLTFEGTVPESLTIDVDGDGSTDYISTSTASTTEVSVLLVDSEILPTSTPTSDMTHYSGHSGQFQLVGSSQDVYVKLMQKLVELLKQLLTILLSKH